MFRPAQVPIGKLGQYEDIFSYSRATARSKKRLNTSEASLDAFGSEGDDFAEPLQTRWYTEDKRRPTYDIHKQLFKGSSEANGMHQTLSPMKTLIEQQAQHLTEQREINRSLVRSEEAQSRVIDGLK